MKAISVNSCQQAPLPLPQTPAPRGILFIGQVMPTIIAQHSALGPHGDRLTLSKADCLLALAFRRAWVQARTVALIALAAVKQAVAKIIELR